VNAVIADLPERLLPANSRLRIRNSGSGRIGRALPVDEKWA